MRAHLTVVGESCPVCGSKAQRGQDTRDVVNIRCPRCGPFTISGTALAMLTSRLGGDKRSCARVSHAIRSSTSDEHGLEIDSTNVDRLIGSALPRPGQQINNFLKWMSVELGDDQMGQVQLPENLDNLASVVGTVDGEPIQALASAMQKEGLIDLLPDRRVRLTMAGWKELDQPQSAAQTEKPSITSVPASPSCSAVEAAFPLEAGDAIKAHCRNCGPGRNAVVLARYIEGPDYDDVFEHYFEHGHGIEETIEDYRILKCRGCDQIYVQRVSLSLEGLPDCGEDVFDPETGEFNPVHDPTTTYWPAPSLREPPVWLVRIEDPVLRGLLKEVYVAIDADLRSIAAMGIRAALDRTFELGGADPAHGFAQKLEALEAQNVIGSDEKKLLQIMTDAGSAASHRGWKPEPEELDSILAATEGLLQRVALLTPAARKIKDRVPPRPERPKK